MTCSRWVLLALLATTACGGESPTAPTTDWIELNSITPSSGTTLTAGERVTFTTTVTCTIVNADGGYVVLLLVDQGNRSLSASSPTAQLSKGTATVTLTDTITVPVSGSTVTAVLPLFVNGSNITRALKRVDYSVR